jgi:tetratricopeptide (TPR) repeat protein
MYLNNLGKLYRSRFKLTGKLADISAAILSGQKAVQLTPEGNVALPVYLTSLGIWFESRFKYTHNMVDLSAAISSKQQAIHLTPQEHTKPTELANLGDLYLQRWERTGNKADISEAISCLEKAVNLNLTPVDLNMPTWLNTLGKFYAFRFECTGNVADLSEAIASIQKSIQITEDGDSELHKRLDNLASSYYSRFDKAHNLADLSEAILSREKAIQLTPNGHPDIPVALYNLAYSYDTLFQHTGRQSDLDKAVSNYSMAITRSSGIPIFKLHANKRLAKISQELYPLQSIDAYSTAIQLACHLAGLHETIKIRLNNLQHISDVSTLAAACAFKLGKINLALEWLEQGRCVVWGQINDLRTPIDVLRAKHPELADDIVRVSSSLEISGSQSREDANFTADSTVKETTPQEETTGSINAKLALEWDQLLAKVRTLPDFEDFIQPLSYSVISEHLPKSGPVVLINIHKDRCDALALVPGTNRPIHIPLPEFTYEKSVALRDHLQANLLASGIRMREAEPLTRGVRPFSKGSMGLRGILRQLWVWVVKPILDALGYSVCITLLYFRRN